MADSASSPIDPYGFERPKDFDVERHEEFMSRYIRVLAHRAKRWSSLSKNNALTKKSEKLNRFVRKGVPLEHRPMVWMSVSGARKRMLERPTLYRELLEGQQDSQLLDLIQTDMPRTFPNNVYFRDGSRDSRSNRGALFNVLVALAHNNKTVGYCQGMNFIAGLLLLILKDERQVFWLMDTLIKDILPDYYCENMMGLKVDCEVLHQLVRLRFPDVYRVVEHCGDSVWLVIATRWFICLFVDVVPTETVLRIWDCLFYEGSTILFRVGLTLIRTNLDAIIKCQNVSELMDVFRGISSGASVADCHTFMQSVFDSASAVSDSLIAQMREECKASCER